MRYGTHRIAASLAALCLSASATFFAGCGGPSQAKAELGAPSESAAALSATKEMAPTIPVRKVSRPIEHRVTGSLIADEQSDVASRRSGIVKDVAVERGTLVKKGDVLVVLDPTDAMNKVREGKAEAAELAAKLGLAADSLSTETAFNADQQPDVKLAKAILDLADRNLKRDKELLEQKVMAAGDFDRTRSEYDTARLKYESARQTASQLFRTYQTSLARLHTWTQLLRDMEVRAPFDGMIAERYSAPGESVREGDRVVSLVRINPLRLAIRIPEQQVALISKGQKVMFQVGAFPDQEFEGTIRHVGPSLEGETRTLLAEAIVPNENALLRPGFFATAKLLSPQEENRLLVPRRAIRFEGDAAMVFIVKDGRARETVVTVGSEDGHEVSVTSGLTGSEMLVAESAGIADGTILQ